jgi:hypothetical protein
MRILPTSPRRRRRIIREGLVLAIAVAVATAVLLLPGSPRSREGQARPEGSAQIVPRERDVPLTAARRRAVNRLLDRFVATAVERRDPALAWSLSGPELRGATRRAEWLAGRLPVYPYSPRGTSFHDWTLDWSTESSIGIDLLLQPRAGATANPIAFRVELGRHKGRWLVDYWLPVASFAPVAETPSTSRADLGQRTQATVPAASNGLAWLVAPLAILAAAAILVPTGLALAAWTRRRRRRAVLPPASRDMPQLPSTVTRRPPPP